VKHPRPPIPVPPSKKNSRVLAINRVDPHFFGGRKNEITSEAQISNRSNETLETQTYLASVSLEILLLLLTGDDVVPVRLTIPHGDLEHVLGPVPLDAEPHSEPVVTAIKE